MAAKTATKRPSIFDSIVEKGQENAKKLEESFVGPVVELATTDIRPNPNNPRKRVTRQSVDEMANAIRQVGEILQPLLVRPIPEDDSGHRYEIVCGDRRLMGARQVGLMTVPVRVREVSDDDAARFALWENIAREDLDSLDLADSINKLRHIDKLTWPDLAARFGVSKQWVWKLQKMSDLPELVKDMVREKRLSAYTAVLLTEFNGTDTNVVGIAEEIIERKMTSRDVERLLDERKGRGKAAQDAKNNKGAFTVSWTPPQDLVKRRYNPVIKAADTLVDSVQGGRIPPALAEALRPVAQALLDLADGRLPAAQAPTRRATVPDTGGSNPPPEPHDGLERTPRPPQREHGAQRVENTESQNTELPKAAPGY